MSKLLLVSFFAYLNVLLAFKYDIQFRDEGLFQPCPGFEDNYFEKFIKMPENITILPDDNIYLEGDVVILYDFEPKKHYQFQIEYFKRERGDWQKTVYTINRPDLCPSLFDPSEIWHPYIKGIPVELRKCPLFKDQIFPLKLKTEQGFELPSPSMEGEYRGHVEIGNKDDPNELFACAEVYLNLFRV